jgi:hypothetical protein
MAYLASEVEWYGTRVLIPSALILVVLAFILLHESSGAYDLGQGWVLFGFIVFLLSFISGAGYLGPESGRLGKLVDERGARGPRVPAEVEADLPDLEDRAPPPPDPGGARHGRQTRPLIDR